MNVIEMMVDNQADLVVHMEVDDVTKELQEMDWEQDEGLERAPMMMMPWSLYSIWSKKSILRGKCILDILYIH